MSIVTHSVEFHIQQSWKRFNALAWHYYGIAESSFDQFLEAEELRFPFPEESDPSEYFEIERRLLSASFQTIVFSGMACEAAIYDLAAIHLGDQYASSYLDKLDLVAKWVVVPSLICGQTFKEDGPAINSLITLVRIRNKLVHHKSVSASPTEDAIQKAEGQLDKIVQNTRTAFQAVVLLSLELNRIMKTKMGVLPLFEKDVLSLSKSQELPRITQTIAHCREIDARS